MSDIQPGDKVRMKKRPPKRSSLLLKCYPRKGKIGIVTNVYDDRLCSVQWPAGSTSGSDWWPAAIMLLERVVDGA